MSEPVPGASAHWEQLLRPPIDLVQHHTVLLFARPVPEEQPRDAAHDRRHRQQHLDSNRASLLRYQELFPK
jgi:hypothetical protein